MIINHRRFTGVLVFSWLVPPLLGLPLSAQETASEIEEKTQTIVEEAKKMALDIAERVRGWSDGKEQSTTYMGVTIESVPDVLRDYIDLPKGVGLLLPRISPDGPAMKAGLQDNDILVSFDGQLVINFNQLSTLIDLKGPGATVPLKILRKGEELELSITLEERIRQGGRFMLPSPPSPPSAPDASGTPVPPEVGQWVERIQDWIPGSVEVYIDDKEQIHVDLKDLQNDLKELRTELLKIRDASKLPAVIREFGDFGARTSVVHVGDRNIQFSNDEGRLVLNASESGQQAMIWDRDGKLLYEGPLPENYERSLPGTAVRILDALKASTENIDLQTQEAQEITINNEVIDPVTVVTN